MPPKTVASDLPAPEIDIMKTDHVRHFTPGSAGPAMDVLLHNQITLIKQNQDLRRKLEQMHGSKGNSIRPETPAPIMPSEDLLETLIECTKRFASEGGQLKFKRTKNTQSFVDKWAQAVRDDEGFDQNCLAEMDEYEAGDLVSLHILCAEKTRGETKGKGKEKAATKATGKLKRKGQKTASISVESDEEDAEETVDDREEKRRKTM